MASRNIITMEHDTLWCTVDRRIVLHQGKIAEMATGEGKTLVSTLPAYLNALAGEGVISLQWMIIFARRDSEWNGTYLNGLV